MSERELRNYVIIPLPQNPIILGPLLRGLRYRSKRGPKGASEKKEQKK